MKAEAQLIAIAEARGWTNLGWDAGGSVLIGTRKLQITEDKIMVQRDHCVPDYLNDRDAVIDAAKHCLDTLGEKIEFQFWFQALASGQKPLPNKFIPQYRRSTDSISEWFDMVTAPPAVWCEALLRTLNKWEQ